MLFDIDPSTRTKIDGLIDKLGEDEFRRRVSVLTRYETTTLSRDNVVCVFVAARRGRVRPPGGRPSRCCAAALLRCTRPCRGAPRTTPGLAMPTGTGSAAPSGYADARTASLRPLKRHRR